MHLADGPGATGGLVLCLAGPTGSGKSRVAMTLAAQLAAELVSVDSAMIYRGMDIGTDKPSAADRARVPHHLVDIRDPSERYSAAEFARDAQAAIRAIHARGRVPILVGGTLLYFRALTLGLSPVPGADAGVRAAIRAEAAARGWADLHRELARVDPESARRIDGNDGQRIERALEIHRLTGLAPSALYRTAGIPAPFRFHRIALWPEDRDAHRRRLAARFARMLEAGLVAEVRRLHARGDLDRELPAVRTLGYRQLWSWLEGECSFDEAVRRAVVATRRYAKRQLTWLRGEADFVRIPAGAGAAEAVLDSLGTRAPRVSGKPLRDSI